MGSGKYPQRMDECGVYGPGYQEARRRNRIVERTIKHVVKVHVWECFSVRDFGTLCVFNGNLNAQRMVQLYKKGLLTTAKVLFTSDTENWILQEDNDRKHRSRLCTGY
ncbi:hypothetical protein Trydic_g1885 [Trypoxylus dichotomus]